MRLEARKQVSDFVWRDKPNDAPYQRAKKCGNCEAKADHAAHEKSVESVLTIMRVPPASFVS